MRAGKKEKARDLYDFALFTGQVLERCVTPFVVVLLRLASKLKIAGQQDCFWSWDANSCPMRASKVLFLLKILYTGNSCRGKLVENLASHQMEMIHFSMVKLIVCQDRYGLARTPWGG